MLSNLKAADQTESMSSSLMTLQQEIKLPSMQTSWKEIRNHSNVIIVLHNKLWGANPKSRPLFTTAQIECCKNPTKTRTLQRCNRLWVLPVIQGGVAGTTLSRKVMRNHLFWWYLQESSWGHVFASPPWLRLAVGGVDLGHCYYFFSAVGCDGNKAAPSSGSESVFCSGMAIWEGFSAWRAVCTTWMRRDQICNGHTSIIMMVPILLDWLVGWNSAKVLQETPSNIFIPLMLCQDRCLHVSHQTRHLVFSFFLRSDSTQSANGPVARAFITQSSCFWSKPPLHMQQDLSTQFRIQPVLREMWRDRHCRGLKHRFVTLLTHDRNINSDFWLLKILLVRSFQFNHGSNVDLENVEMCRRHIFVIFLEIPTPGISITYL